MSETALLDETGLRSSTSQPAVSMTGVRKSFGKIGVLRGVDFELKKGEVHALLGANGAGKSTLMKILQGVHRPDGGTIRIDGREVDFHSPHDAADAGIGMVFQEFSLIPSLSVGRNMFLGREPKRFGLIDDRELYKRANRILERMGADLDPRRILSELPVGYWQLTEIAKALSLNAEILIMDEPTASLPYNEVEQLFDLIERLKTQGISIVYISHRMAEIARVADRLSVIRDGANVLTGVAGEVSPEQVVESIVGREILEGLSRAGHERAPDSPPALRVSNLSAGHRILDISFDVQPGEIVGLAGLIGSGRTELARCLFGIDKIDSGEVALGGKTMNLRSPGDAIRAGIVLVPEDRHLEGLVMEHSVRSNLLLPGLSRLNRGPVIQDKKGRLLCEELMGALNIRASAMNSPVAKLSGGNQQKVVISKWLGLQNLGLAPSLVILDEPTKGVDIATKTEIMQLVLDMADAGVAIVVISSELEELLSVADRVLVMRNGQIDSEFGRDEIPSEEFLQLAVQGVQ